MKIQEAIDILEKGGFITVSFGSMSMSYEIGDKHSSNRITENFYNKIKAKYPNRWEIDVLFVGITKQYHKLKP